MIVHIEEIKEAIEKIDKFNQLNLKKIQLMENGKPIPISKEILKEWHSCGLSNKSFIEMEFWKESNFQFDQL